MAKIRCPYCHEYIDGAAFPAHEAKHRKIRSDGQQNDYATLPVEDREQSDLAGVPRVYVHSNCGAGTEMPEQIIRSYLKNPFLYNSNKTFCTGCGKPVPFSECVWSETGEDLQSYINKLQAAKQRSEKEQLLPKHQANQSDLEKMLTAILIIAKDNLVRQDGFRPFALLLQADEDKFITAVRNKPGESDEQMLKSLEKGLRDQTRTGKYRAVAWSFHTEFELHTPPRKLRAILVRLEHVTGKAAEVLVPFEKNSDYSYYDRIVRKREQCMFVADDN